MDRAIAARIQEWDTRPLTAGYSGLHELADANFSGAVTTGTAWLFMLNGRVVGVVDGTMSAFESEEATAYEAPDPALPLLFAMQERGGATQAKYYTDDNPLPEVHETLSDAGFTGYIELSENVLSGDYYVVYYGGKSMSAAFVGNSGRLVTGDEAFHQAADEVGIYEVKDVELDVRAVPEPTDDVEQTAADAGDEEPPAEAPDDPVDEPAESGEPEPTPPSAEPEPSTADPVAPGEGEAGTEPVPGGEPATGSGDPFSQEEAWREARTIPALDPDETEAPDPATAENGGAAVEEPPANPMGTSTAQSTSPSPSQPPQEDERLEELRAAVESQSATIEELQARLEATQGDAESLRQERERLEAELQSGAGETAGAPDAGVRSLDPNEALEQTDLFIRYGTKGGGTLEKAHDGIIDREEVVNNLHVEHHTRFDAAAVRVGGQHVQSWLEGTVEHRFVDWLVTHLLFEIQDTGSQRGLRDLFDAIPLIDRVEFHGVVELSDEEGETTEVPFDVVCRDRMGQPLVVANINDDRDPATGEMMTGLIEGASAVAEAHESLGGAIMVTSSFFQPDALETAAEATGGGLLGREKRWSYVKLGRKQGFHLCLVEARRENFHVAVPEL